MNRNKLKAYAPQARRDFIKAVTDRAAYYGLMKNKIEPITEQGDVAIISGKAFPRAVATKRKRLENLIGRQGFEQVMEAMAYTWFNRFVAIRFMELQGYLDHGYRVLSHPDGKTTPESLEHAEHVNLPGLNREKMIELKLEATKESELYRMLLIAQCNALHKAMPFLFEWIDDETELLLPENLLHSDSLIRKLVNEVPEEDWQEVEIIGWLYQFYISEKKDQVIGKVVKSEDIPAATQLFTPNWIVKYLVQNSLGRQWVATYPNSPLKQQMEYYIEPAQQTPEVQEQLKAITPESLNPEELTLLDPACGSGHILVEAYDLLKAIYHERGYRAKDIPRLILEKNLYGLEIDDRAAQLAAFALMMKARADDRRIFENGLQPHVLAIRESKGLDAKEITEALNSPILKTQLPPSQFLFEEMEDARTPLFSRRNLSVPGQVSQADVAQLIGLFEHSKTFGSLIRVPEELAEKLPGISERVKDVFAHGDMFGKEAAASLRPLVEQARILTGSYDCVVANPPYMGSQYFNSTLKEFSRSKYRTAKGDLFAVFIDRAAEVVKNRSFMAFMTPFTWLTIASYEGFRKSKIDRYTFLSLVKPEYHAFFDSAYVPICAFSMQKVRIHSFKTTCFDMGEFYGADVQPIKLREGIKNRSLPFVYARDFQEFEAIPSCPLTYSLNHNLLLSFQKKQTIGRDAKKGLATGDNDRFLRLWHEIDRDKFSVFGGKKWFPTTKGGPYRKWYGNFDVVINWEDDGREIRHFKDENGRLRSRPQNLSYNFKEGITWNLVTVSDFTARYVPNQFVFNDVGPMVFGGNILHRIGMLNSKVNTELLRVLCPTMKFEVGLIAQVPIGEPPVDFRGENQKQCIGMAKADWDSFETSWDFQITPMLTDVARSERIESAFTAWEAWCNDNIQTMKRLEEENNRFFIHHYGLEGELTSEVPVDQITLVRADQERDIKRLLSYAIGCVMGRYSLDKPGLIYAHSGNKNFDPSWYKTFPADQDGMIPITDTDWFGDDAANRIVEFIGVAWPKEHLEENLKFVAESLGSNRGESPRETIRRYLATAFFKHHLSMYKKRPIYWLFSSGKHRAFQCLVYLHRYNEGTLSRMRTEYVIPLQGKISARIDQLAGDIAKATSTSHRKKLERERDKLVKQQAELRTFDEKLRHYADQRISLDLDDGVKVNYGKFGDLLAEVKAVTGTSEE